VGMLQLRRNRDLSQETFRPKGYGEFGPQHFHRHLAGVFEILGDVHRGHTPRADLPLDGVAVGESGFETDEGVGQDRDLGLGDASKMYRAASDGQRSSLVGKKFREKLGERP